MIVIDNDRWFQNKDISREHNIVLFSENELKSNFYTNQRSMSSTYAYAVNQIEKKSLVEVDIEIDMMYCHPKLLSLVGSEIDKSIYFASYCTHVFP